jgi:chromosome condensin MukBEF ATPase and DNA-binding subunit MukB
MWWRKKQITFTEQEVNSLVNKIKKEMHDSRLNEIVARTYFAWLVTTKNNK